MINPTRRPYVAKPSALWPLTKSTLDEETGLFADVSETAIPSDNGDSAVRDIGFELYHAKTKLSQSPIFSGNDSVIQSYVILDYRNNILYWHGLSILFWIKIENKNETKSDDLPIMVSGHISRSPFKQRFEDID